MAKKIIQMKDKYKSTTNLYPKVTMGSLSPAVKSFIQAQKTTPFNVVYYTNVEPTYDSQHDNYVLALTDIRNVNYQSPVEASSYIAYIDSEDKIQSLYRVYVSGSSVVVLLEKLGDFSAGGGTKYLHNISLEGFINNNAIRGIFTIPSDSPLPFVKSSQYVEGTNQNLMEWLYSHGFDATLISKSYYANIYAYDNQPYQGIGAQNDYFYTTANSTLARLQITGTTINDTVIPF